MSDFDSLFEVPWTFSQRDSSGGADKDIQTSSSSSTVNRPRHWIRVTLVHHDKAPVTFILRSLLSSVTMVARV